MAFIGWPTLYSLGMDGLVCRLSVSHQPLSSMQWQHVLSWQPHLASACLHQSASSTHALLWAGCQLVHRLGPQKQKSQQAQGVAAYAG